ncbi:MAG: alkaline phosphatase family protein [Flavobacteriaceae bacterium]|nr:alkaline phosphatase family protein [Flavobacteriaceae bacterium]
MKNAFLKLLILILFLQCTGQKKITNDNFTNRPKLVIGIVIDQMRYDYLIRFYDKYSDAGFKKLINNGFNCENVHFNYVPTHTAVGHASIYTGTTPDNHGIIGNYWFDKVTNKSIYCVDDINFKAVGSNNGGKSPSKLQVTTLSDQLHLAQNNKGKAIGISLKDRASILPVGHTANAAYWFKGKNEGKFITSSYYMDKLPKWVINFNNSNIVSNYLKKPWKTLYNSNTYTESIEDNNDYEKPLKGSDKVTFPYDLPTIFKTNKDYGLIRSTPFGNSLLVDFAKATIIGENLGKGIVTDFLSVSFSSTDYIGHTFGVDSKEIEDTYLRLDQDLANFIKFLDGQIGKHKYTLFLTADHGALSSYTYLESLKIPSRYFDNNAFKEYANKLTLKYFKTSSLIKNISNFQIFFDKKALNHLNLTSNEVAEKLVDDLINFKGIARCVTAKTLQTTNFTQGILHYVQNGYNQKLSGDIILIPQPNTVTYHSKGSEHSTGFSYDTHVPLIFYGYGVKQGNSKKYIPITDIAPTISSLLKIEFPNGNTGKIIEELFN